MFLALFSTLDNVSRADGRVRAVESMGHSMRVHVSDATASLLRDKFDLQMRDAIHVKGKGAAAPVGGVLRALRFSRFRRRRPHAHVLAAAAQGGQRALDRARALRRRRRAAAPAIRVPGHGPAHAAPVAAAEDTRAVVPRVGSAAGHPPVDARRARRGRVARGVASGCRLPGACGEPHRRCRGGLKRMRDRGGGFFTTTPRTLV